MKPRPPSPLFPLVPFDASGSKIGRFIDNYVELEGISNIKAMGEIGRGSERMKEEQREGRRTRDTFPGKERPVIHKS